MQRVKKGDSVNYDTTLDAVPAYVKVSGFPGDYDYTTVLYRST